jgi:hypothetical protein
MDDTWETDHQFNPQNPADGPQDADGDGYTNKQEYEAGTDPHSAASFLQIDDVDTDFSGTGTVFIRFLATSNKTYTVQGRNSLTGAGWSRITDVPSSSTNRMVEVMDQPGVGVERRYYRLVTPIAQ